MSDTTPLRVVLYSPDRARHYDGRTPECEGVGGGITARLSLVEALAAQGHDVTAYVHCEAPLDHRGVRYRPLDTATRIDCDVFIAISTGGALTFAPLRAVLVNASLRIVWVQGAPRPADLGAVAADYVYVASNFLRDVCVTRWGVPERHVFVCYNGIHQEYFRSVEADPPPRDPFAIAYVGPPEKGLDACVQVLRRLRRDDARFHLDVFGGDLLWGRAAGSQPEEPGLRFKGLLGQRQLAAALFRYEYCLALQAMEEGFGIAAQEAKRAGAIVIASAVGAFDELIRHGSDGYLIAGPHDSAAALEEAGRLIVSLAEDPSRRERIRRRAVQTPWSWDLAARTWTAHWRHALANAKPATGSGVRQGVLDLPDGAHLPATGAYCPAVYPQSPMHDRLGIGAPRRMLIGGYYGHGNLGDEAILSVLLDRIQQARPDLELVVASGDPQRTSRQHDVASVDERDIAALEHATERSDLLVLGGGGLFHDHYGVDESTLMTARHWGLTYCAAWPVMARLFNKPLTIVAAGVGPLHSGMGQRLTREIFEHAGAATVRDAESRELLDAIGVKIDGVGVGADPAFLLTSAPPDRVGSRLRRMGMPGDRPFVAVALRQWDAGLEGRQWESAVAGALDRLVAERHVALLFVPFQSGTGAADANDEVVAGRVRGLMQRATAVTIADTDVSPALVQGVFAASKLVVAMRLHAVILAANANVPFVALRYDDKVRHAVNRLGLGAYAIDLGDVTADRLWQRIQGALDARDDFQRAFGTRLPAIRGAAAAGIAGVTTRERAGAEAPASTTGTGRDLRPAEHGRARAPAYIRFYFRAAARAVLPAPWRRALREGWQRRLMSREAFVFDRYKRARIRQYGMDLDGFRAPGEPGLVSVVLPAYNGATMMREAIDSILGQTGTCLELIIVNDGSTDNTGAVADDYAHQDQRVRVVHQDNRQLPAALSAGFRLARGEFYTWVSCDNRLKPGGLRKLVDCLRRHPHWDMVYGNVDLIGEDGRPLRRSPHYASYQQPDGSDHVRLPAAATDLNTRANNFIGAGFLYRSRVAFLLGDYDRFRFGLEDYDYWMRVNALMTLRHADFDDPVADYRFHGGSLTARAEALGLPAARERLMVFDQFRRDFYLAPVVWVFADPAGGASVELALRARQAGHVVYDGSYALGDLPALWIPVAHVAGSDAAQDADQLFRTIDIRVKTEAIAAIERFAEAPPAPVVRASVVICTRRPSSRLSGAIDAALAQDYAPGQFEVIVVNNNPADAELAAVLNRRRPHIITVVCPLPGLSAARNAGLATARGKYVCFLDDDAVADPMWLARICRAFDEHADTGVVGGPILLEVPEPRPRGLATGWETYWSHFAPVLTRYTEVESWRAFPWGANWAARRSVLAAIGGFRTSFGRTGSDFSGGEELVAAVLARRIGWRVAIVPDAIVHHRVDPARFTTEHVRQTTIARHLVAHAAQRELLMPNAPGVMWTLVRLALHHVDPRVRSWRHILRDVRYRKAAQVRLLRTQLRDLRERRRTPAVLAP